jgi:hypothetical protein
LQLIANDTGGKWGNRQPFTYKEWTTQEAFDAQSERAINLALQRSVHYQARSKTNGRSS